MALLMAAAKPSDNETVKALNCQYKPVKWAKRKKKGRSGKPLKSWQK